MAASPPRTSADQTIKEQAARPALAKTALLPTRMGQLSLEWSNCESLLIYIIQALLSVPVEKAATIFATLNTTRARLDLVQRLSKLTVMRKGVRKDLDAIITDFAKATRLRNALYHAIFVSDESGGVTHVRSMKLEEQKGVLRFGDERAIDDAFVTELDGSIALLIDLNQRIWALLPALKLAG